jgi:hypothetical protein
MIDGEEADNAQDNRNKLHVCCWVPKIVLIEYDRELKEIKSSCAAKAGSQMEDVLKCEMKGLGKLGSLCIEDQTRCWVIWQTEKYEFTNGCFFRSRSFTLNSLARS